MLTYHYPHIPRRLAWRAKRGFAFLSARQNDDHAHVGTQIALFTFLCARTCRLGAHLRTQTVGEARRTRETVCRHAVRVLAHEEHHDNDHHEADEIRGREHRTGFHSTADIVAAIGSLVPSIVPRIEPIRITPARNSQYAPNVPPTTVNTISSMPNQSSCGALAARADERRQHQTGYDEHDAVDRKIAPSRYQLGRQNRQRRRTRRVGEAP